MCERLGPRVLSGVGVAVDLQKVGLSRQSLNLGTQPNGAVGPFLSVSHLCFCFLVIWNTLSSIMYPTCSQRPKAILDLNVQSHGLDNPILLQVILATS